MDQEEIATLCQALRIDDRKKTVIRMDQDTFLSRRKELNICLVGNVIRNKAFNRDVFCRVIPLAYIVNITSCGIGSLQEIEYFYSSI